MDLPILEHLSNIFETRMWRDGLQSVQQCEWPLALIREFAFEMENAGFWSVLYNSTGEFAREIVVALNLIGDERTAKRLESAINVYLRGEVPQDTRQRRKLMASVGADGSAASHEVEDHWIDGHLEPYHVQLLRYAEAHLKEFVVTEEEAPSAKPIEADWRQCDVCCDAWQQAISEKFCICPSCGAFTCLRRTP
jgi:hypothetical protein